MAKKPTVIDLLQIIITLLENKPVAAPKPQPRVINDRFTDNGDGTVSDNLKKTTWIKRPHTDLPEKFKGEMNFADRETACKELKFAGKSNWRQPTRDELESMRDFTRSNPAVNTDIFPDIKPAWYGTGEEVQDHSDWNWCVGFHYGSVFTNHKDGYLYVWPVRSSQ